MPPHTLPVSSRGEQGKIECAQGRRCPQMGVPVHELVIGCTAARVCCREGDAEMQAPPALHSEPLSFLVALRIDDYDQHIIRLAAEVLGAKFNVLDKFSALCVRKDLAYQPERLQQLHITKESLLAAKQFVEVFCEFEDWLLLIVGKLHPSNPSLLFVIFGEQELSQTLPHAFTEQRLVTPFYLDRWLNLKNLYSTILQKPKIFFKAALDECKVAYEQPLVGSAWVAGMSALLRELATRGSLLPHVSTRKNPAAGPLLRQQLTRSAAPPSAATGRLSFTGPASAQPFRYLMILDFEATCDDKNKGRFAPQEIIELPTCVLNTSTLQVEAEFHTYVRPARHPRLTSFCTQLTGIQQAQVDTAPAFPDVWTRYQEWLAALGALEATQQVAFVTCGDWDLKTMLPAQLEVSRLPHAPLLLRRWINVKKLFQVHYRTPHAGDMTGMLRHLHLALEGRHHSGIDDARNITRIVKRMIQDGCIFHLTWQ